MLYLYRYKLGSSIKAINIREKYDHDIHKVVYNFFAVIQNNESLNINHLKRAWGSLWLGNKTGDDIILSTPSTWRDSANSKRKDGIQAIIRFFDKFKGNPGYPIAVNHPYKVSIGDGIIVLGTWEVIREVEDLPGQRVVEIIDFKVDDKLYNKVHFQNDIEITAMSYAFRETFNEVEDRILYYGMNKGANTEVTRSESDYEFMKHTVKDVVKSIQNDIYYARVGGDCYHCPYRRECEKGLHDKLKKGVQSVC